MNLAIRRNSWTSLFVKLVAISILIWASKSLGEFDVYAFSPIAQTYALRNGPNDVFLTIGKSFSDELVLRVPCNAPPGVAGKIEIQYRGAASDSFKTLTNCNDTASIPFSNGVEDPEGHRFHLELKISNLGDQIIFASSKQGFCGLFMVAKFFYMGLISLIILVVIVGHFIGKSSSREHGGI